MKQKVFLALVALVLGMFVHGYLTARYYPLHFGFATGKSICNINAKLDCDAVSASQFAAFIGIPMAVWGLVFNGVLFMLVMGAWWGLRGSDARPWREALWLALFSVGMSAVMGAISQFFLSVFCLFCIFAYILSAIVFLALWWAQPATPRPHLAADVRSWFSDRRGFLVWLALIPAGAGLVHIGMSQNYSPDRLDAMIKSSLAEWERTPAVQLNLPPALVKGAAADQARMVIAEFADYRCPHCKAAAPSLSAFTNAHPDVRLLFYAYPLDGSCNSAIGRSDGVSCRLAKAVYCAERQSKGWALHERIFDEQEFFHRAANSPDTDRMLQPHAKELGIDWAPLETCMNDAATDTAIRAQADLGTASGVKGTPTIYVNGRKLDQGQLIPTLTGAYERSAAK
jgi:protein-disulfide isomerase/uncharacterized membrane protein